MGKERNVQTEWHLTSRGQITFKKVKKEKNSLSPRKDLPHIYNTHILFMHEDGDVILVRLHGP